MVTNRRDAGLARAVGPWGLAASIVSMVVGAGIFAVPGALAASVGPFAPLAILLCAGAVGAVAMCFAEGGSRIPSSGGAYGYVEAAFGPLAGYVAGTLLWFSNVLGCGSVAAALADVVVSVLPPVVRAPAHAGVVVAAIGGIAVINTGGVRRGIRLVNVVTVLKLLPLAVFLLVGAAGVQASNFRPETSAGAAGLGRALILALFAFMGMETALCASGEVARPERTIPRALALAMASVTVLYVGIQVVAQGILGPALATSTVPLADAMARLSPALRLLMLGGAAVSMFGYLSSDLLGSPRMLFAFARDGLLPGFLGRLRSGTQAPHLAIACYASLAIVLALSGTFTELAVLATLTSAALYVAGCAAAWRLARRGVARAGTPLGFRWLGTAMAVGIASMLAFIALASTREIAGLASLIAASSAVYLLQTRLGHGRSRDGAA